MIVLPRTFLERMLAHSREALPHEACGVLAGHSHRVVALYPVPNVARQSTTFRFDPARQAEVFHEVESNGWDLLAFFHSHPTTEAFPSATDRERAFARDPWSGEPVPAYPRTRTMIVSMRGASPELRAYRYEGGAPVEEEVLVT